jgi:NAD(P)H-hydrate epimerase
VIICGGSRGLTGAVCLSATAAIRSGAGYATVVVPAELEQIFEVKLTEVMSVGCPSREGVFRGAAEEQIVAACEGADAIVFGPGIGREPSLERLLRSLISRLSSPLVIDADAFQALSGALALISERRQPTVITPHAGELARLLDEDSTQIAEHRLESALEAARISKAVVVSKGDDTIVTDGDRVAINPYSTPGLATAGTGDILSGMIGAMLARGLDPFEAACVAVKAHARAGLAAVDRVGADSVIAGDVLDAIPEGLKR